MGRNYNTTLLPVFLLFIQQAYTFTSKNIVEKVAFDDISKPSEISFMMKFEFKTPDIMIESAINNNKVTETYTINRIKK